MTGVRVDVRDEGTDSMDPLAFIPVPAVLRRTDADALLLAGPMRLVSVGPIDSSLLGIVRELLADAGVTTVTDDTALSADAESDGTATLTLSIGSTTGSAPADGLAHRESYSLSVTSDGVRIAAPSAAGIFYGVQTLVQALDRSPDGALRVPALEIEDSPRFDYRGMMLDVARHFFDVATVKAVIDRAATLKLNHLHLHLSDDQGWRLHIESWPELTARASSGAVGGGAGGFYTHDDYREIVAYALERFVTIVPEIDLPGHTHAALVAYPELAPAGYAGPPLEGDDAGAPRASTAPYTGTEVGFSTLDVRNDRVYDVVADVIREITALTPGPYLHLGGDESHSTTAEEYLVFLERLSAIAEHSGKTLVFWHEAGVSDALPTGSVGQFWGFVTPRDDSAVTRRFVERGGRLILSPADAIYLDMKHTDGDAYGLVWADGPTSIEAAYSWDPDEVIEGVDESDILGVEAPLWSETIDSLTGIDALAFPRLLAAAEIAWSPRPVGNEDRTWAAFRRRVAAFQPRLDTLGIAYTRAEGIDWS
jgi:hexosaminidase